MKNRECSYNNKANDLLEKLLLGDDLGPNKSSAVMSFNYTSPPLNREVSKVVGKRYINMHGDLKTSIILGIDGKEWFKNSDLLRFTKAYRVAGVEKNNDRAKNKSLASLVNDDVCIKFYGHSLGESDYSYFQVIFDKVNLYDSDARLIFYYNSSSVKAKVDQKEAIAKDEVMKRAFNLLSLYGKTLANREQGKALAYKLQSEGRLEFRKYH